MVTLTIWGVSTAGIGRALLAMATPARSLRTVPGLSFARRLGTGAGTTFLPGDADPRHWATLACWTCAEAAQATGTAHPFTRWDSFATERLDITMRPLASRGQWGGVEPFGTTDEISPDGPVAAITRARLRWRPMRGFFAAVPAVTADLHSGQYGTPTLALGIGEAPLGLTGTFSLWPSQDDLRRFAYASPAHRRVIGQTPEQGWYAEELFARFTVDSVRGVYRGQAWDLTG